MRTSPILLALLCGMVVLAGCSAVPGVGGDESAAYSPAGESLDTAQLQTDHVENVQSVDSYRVAVEQRTVAADGSVAANRSTDLAVDRAANRTLVDSNVSYAMQSVSTTQYVTADRTYLKQGVGNETRYRTVPANAETGLNATATLTLATEWRTIDRIEWTQNGTETFDGVTVTRYSASGVEDNAAALGVNDSSDLSSFDASLLVTSEGTVRLLTATMAASGENPRTQTVRLELTAFDDTTVEEPGWLDQMNDSSTQ